MANGKKSFVLYCDLIHTVELLDDDLAGKLMKHLLRYVNDRSPETDDKLLQIVFEPIKRQLKRDLLDWDEKIKKRVNSGRIGGLKSGESRRKKQSEANEANASSLKQSEANEAVTVTVNVNDTVSREIPKERKSKIVVEKETNDSFFYFFRRAAGSHISDTELRQEVGKFRNKYPNVHANQSGALINAWVSNIGKEKTTEKKMVL